MAFTTIEYTYAGQTSFPLPFPLGILSREYVTVRVNNAIDGAGDPLYYTDFTWLSDSEIVINGLVIGDTVLIVRTVPKTELVSIFSAGADITRVNLDKQSKQVLMAQQEILDGRYGTDLNAIENAIRAEAAAEEATAASNTVNAVSANFGINTRSELRVSNAPGPVVLADGTTWVTDGLTGNTAADDNDLTSVVNVTTGIRWRSLGGEIPKGTFDKGILPIKEFETIEGQGRETVLRRLSGAGSFITATDQDNLYIADLSMDLDFTANGEAGHGFSLADCSDVVIDNVRIYNHGNNGGSAGSGVLAFATNSAAPVEFVRVSNTRAEASTAVSTDTNGILLSDARYSFMYGNYASGQKSFAHELKQNSQYNASGMLIATNSAFGLGYGQTTVGDDGCDFNANTTLVTRACDQGLIVGEGDYNIFSTQVTDSTGALGPVGDIYGVHFSTDATNNVHLGALVHGLNMVYPVRMRSNDNYVAVADHSGATSTATFDATASGNVVEVLHPGTGRTSILGRINDVDSANTVWSGATGEFYRPKSGRVHVRTGISGGTALANQKLVAESDGDCYIAALCGASGVGGFNVGVGTQVNRGTLLYNNASGYWTLAGAGGTIAYRTAATYFRCDADNAASLGLAGQRWTEVFAVNGTISTSDARLKTPLRDLTSMEIAASKDCAKVIGVWKWLSSVEEKGEDARLHVGPTVQDVISIMEKHGLNPMEYSFICYDEWEEDIEAKTSAGNRYSLRKDEFALFVLRGQEARLTLLENK